ncbi:hypothetical protein RN001_003275 [Aquatica leii]|uniref:Serine/threonine-protein phosphatase 4 regulatory subunit 2 n=1 Tax=Aquatica leii TaxID=1421715 RepID=A0AAN7PI33_9COLE|nr:hypothetical protein RN001_003275 [Aquatica leii]
MENPEEILHSLEEFSKLKPKDIPRELEDYLCFVAKTGDPVYQWGTIKSLFKEKLINVITDFYESCPSVDIPPCPNVEVFNYESMKTFILDKLDTFPAAPFTVQRICELLTSPRKQYNRIDKYMRALEKNILVVSTTEPGFRRSAENGEGIVNGLESDHLVEGNNLSNDINVEEMDESPVWPRLQAEAAIYQNVEHNSNNEARALCTEPIVNFCSDSRNIENASNPSTETVITCRPTSEQPYVSIEPVASDSCAREGNVQDSDVTVTITAIPAAVQKRRDSIEPVVSSGDENTETIQPNNSDDSNEEKPETLSPTEIISESTKSEVENATEDSTINDATLHISKEIISSNVDIGSGEPVQSKPLIQIPIISEISSGVICDEIQDVDSVPILNLQEPVETNADTVVNEKIDPVSDAAADVSTTVSSTVGTEDVKVVSETVTVGSPVSQETSVSSTDDLSSDASDVALTVTEIDQTNEVKPYEATVSEDSPTNCVVDTNSGIALEETESNNSDEMPFHNEEYASSSTSRDSMDVDIGEETCQEAATSEV